MQKVEICLLGIDSQSWINKELKEKKKTCANEGTGFVITYTFDLHIHHSI